MTGSSVEPVLIVGAGPVGLVLALTLLKNGISVRIIDKEQKPHLGQRGAGIMPRSLELYHHLGVLSDIQAKAYPLVPTRVYKLPGGVGPIKTFYMDTPTEPTPSVPFTNIVALGQDNAEAILRSHLAKHGCFVEFGTELRSLKQHADHVEAQVAKASVSGEDSETVRSRWLVGTDGAKGIVRKELDLSFLGETRGDDQRFVIGDLQVQGLDRDHWHFWGDMSTILVMLRPTEEEGMFALFLGGRIDHAKVAASREELIKVLRAGTDRTDLVLSEVRWLSEFRPNIRMVNKFGEGRVFVAGDAAHVHSPFGAQGMNSGIQDSFNLGWKLALVMHDLAAPSLLSTYTEERLPVIAAMLKRTTAILDQTVDTMKSDGSGSEVWNRGGTLKQLGVNYRWSSIVIDERAPTEEASTTQALDPYGAGDGEVVRAGDRAPDASGLLDVKSEGGVDADETMSLFHIFSPSHHTVLLFSRDANQVATGLGWLKQYPQYLMQSAVIHPASMTGPFSAEGANHVLVDRDGHAYTEYGCTSEDFTIVIVRPDGIIGGIVFGSEGLESYFRSVLSALSIA